MKFFGQQSSTASAQELTPHTTGSLQHTDTATLIDHEEIINVDVDHSCEDADDDDDDDVDVDNGDMDSNDKEARSEAELLVQGSRTQAQRVTDSSRADDVTLTLTSSSSVDVTEACVTTENGREKKKKEKKPLKKRVRKRAWRAVRSGWKYFRRGMAACAPGLSAVFTWGVNFNQTGPVFSSRTVNHRASRYY